MATNEYKYLTVPVTSSIYSVIDSSIYNTSILRDNSTWQINGTIPTYSQPITSVTPNTTLTHPPSLIVDGEIMVKGENLSEIIQEIRDALYLLKRDKMREEKYKELKLAAEEYNKILHRIQAMEIVVGEDSIK
jgi:hypothetical protein